MQRCPVPRRLPRERGAALILAIIVIFILTVLGLALMFTTSTEFQIAGAETTVNKAFYASDSGVQYGISQARDGLQQGSCAATIDGTTYSNFWCFAVPQQSPSVSTVNSPSTAPTLTVNVSPMTQVDATPVIPGNVEAGVNKMWSIGWHFDSYSSAPAPLNAQKHISVEFTASPVPFPEPPVK